MDGLLLYPGHFVDDCDQLSGHKNEMVASVTTADRFHGSGFSLSAAGPWTVFGNTMQLCSGTGSPL